VPPDAPSAPAALTGVAVGAAPSAAAAGTAARALGAFIRAHRERVSPEAAGISVGIRRRTPGLRREEVAQLCGVSPTWYTWIEQGRDVSASAAALARIADALRLSRPERAYLFELAGQRDPASGRTSEIDVPAALHASVSAIAGPAYLLDRQWNALSWNDAAAELFVGWLSGDADRNLLRYMFHCPSARTLVVDWAGRAARLVAEFRADSSRHLDAPPMRDFLTSLSETSPAFAAFWASQDVVDREGGRRAFEHPRLGHVTFEQITWKAALYDDLKLVMLVPQLL
jgi:transcriptional regulator with XRE-family HTH domain